MLPANPDFEYRNLELIRTLYPQYYERLISIPSTPGAYSVENIDANTFRCQMITPDWQRIWIHGPGNPWNTAEAQIQRVGWTKQRTFVVLRPGLGYIPLSLYPNLRKGSQPQRMLLVEDRDDLFRLSLHLFDWTDLLRSDRTILVLTEKPLETIYQFFATNPVAILPPLCFMLGVEAGPAERQAMEILRKHLGDMSQTVHRAAQQYVNELHAHYRTVAQSAGHRKRILLVEPEHDYLAGPIAQAFRDEGCEVETFKGNRRLLHFLNPYIWLVYTREHFPDVLLWMNRNTLSLEGMQNLSQLPIAKVLWYLDNPKRVQTSREELDATDHYFSFDPTYLSYLRDLGGKAGFPLSTAAGIVPLPECEPGRVWPERRGPDVGFMGALAADRFQDVLNFWLRRDPEFVQILDAIVEEYLLDSRVSLEDRFRDSPGWDRLPFSGFVVLYLEERSTYLRRLRGLVPLRDLGLVTYGAEEWGNPEWAKSLTPCYSKQQPQYEKDLAGIYYHTRINVNIFHVQCVDSTNPRVYDVLAAGGFLLTEHRPAIEREFEIGEHLVCFHSPEEAREKAEYYLSHPEERETIARAGQEFVLNHATYRHRVREILAHVS